MQSGGRDDPRELLEVLWLPILSIRDAPGVHTLCHFLLHVMLQSHVEQHPMYKLYSSTGKRGGGDVPHIAKARRMLRAHFDHVPQAVLNQRMSSLSMMFLATVVENDNAKLRGNLTTQSEFDVKPILDIALGALSAST